MSPVAPVVNAVYANPEDQETIIFGKMGDKTIKFHIPKRNMIKPAFSVDGNHLFTQDLYGKNFFWIVGHLWV